MTSLSDLLEQMLLTPFLFTDTDNESATANVIRAIFESVSSDTHPDVMLFFISRFADPRCALEHVRQHGGNVSLDSLCPDTQRNWENYCEEVELHTRGSDATVEEGTIFGNCKKCGSSRLLVTRFFPTPSLLWENLSTTTRQLRRADGTEIHSEA
jgi:hypothetical protein